MCALQFASQVEQKQIDKSATEQNTILKLSKLNELLGKYLDK